ncbi:hypothetical protein BOX15_Mlig025439g3 [Macrostomum lignano]|uniref:Fragile site-associated protein C-terminal domain-containing protein n=1 Tax=Macrostomum lignano TaxID=282301 RepID=A0A267G4J1_9PLAT|nr:hypothetical protein BOX15_Mlig025439g3 [Macrostomum lignano]
MNLLNTSASTHPLTFRLLERTEHIMGTVTVHYPLDWNGHQHWGLDFIVDMAGDTRQGGVAFLFDHKNFFKALTDDWVGSHKNSVFKFLPYTYKISVVVNNFFVKVLANDYNWLDNSTGPREQENAIIGLTGDSLKLDLTLPYTEYLPDTVKVNLLIDAANPMCSLYLPSVSSCRYLLENLNRNLRITDRQLRPGLPFSNHAASPKPGWIDCVRAPEATVHISFTYYPMPWVESARPYLPDDFFNSEACVVKDKRLPQNITVDTDKFDVSYMSPDLIEVSVEVSHASALLHGAFIRHFIHVKENYFGAHQTPREFDPSASSNGARLGRSRYPRLIELEKFDPRDWRPFGVRANLAFHEIQGHLPCHSSDQLPLCPTLFVNCLSFELNKQYDETRLQLCVSPAQLFAFDSAHRVSSRQLQQGMLLLGGLQVRGHAMFSHKDLPIDCETLEYAWLIEVTIGDASCRLTLPQLAGLIQGVQAFVFSALDSENELQPASKDRVCVHGQTTSACSRHKRTDSRPSCFHEEQLKYKLLRLSVDQLNLCLVESGTCLSVQLDPIRLSNCNLHSEKHEEGYSALLPTVSITQFVFAGKAAEIDINCMEDGAWIEVAAIRIGPIVVNAGLALGQPDLHAIQDAFLRLHDRRFTRLWFLWPTKELPATGPAQVQSAHCGCLGGCAFFGDNLGGQGFYPDNLGATKNRFVPQLIDDGRNSGVAQSILVPSQFYYQAHSGALCRLQFAHQLSQSGGACSNGSAVLAATANVSVQLRQSRHMSASLSRIQSAEQQLLPSSPSGTSAGQQRDSDLDTLRRSSQHRQSSNDSLSRRASSALAGDNDSGSTLSNMHRRYMADYTPAFDDSPDREFAAGMPRPTSLFSRVSTVTTASYKSALMGPAGSSGSGGGGGGRSSSTDRGIASGGGEDASGRGSVSSFYTAASNLSVNRLENLGAAVDNFGQQQQHSMSADVDGEDDTTLMPTTLIGAGHSAILTSTSGVAVPVKDDDDDSYASDASTEDGGGGGGDKRGGGGRSSSGRSVRTDSLCGHSSDEDADYDEGGAGGGGFDNGFGGGGGGGRDSHNWLDLHSLMTGSLICDNPLLIRAYLRHLSKFSCRNWTSRDSAPEFIIAEEGFSTRLLVDETTSSSSHDLGASSTSSSFHQHNSSFHERRPSHDSYSAASAAASAAEASKTVAVVRLRRRVDLLVTPIALECAKRYADILTPLVETMSPSSILDNYHFACASTVSTENKQKKAKHSDKLAATAAAAAAEESKAKRQTLQLSAQLPRLCVCFLQISTVEERFDLRDSTAGLEDLTCVSLLALGVDALSVQAVVNNSMRRLRSLPRQPTAVSGGGGGGGSSGAASNEFEENVTELVCLASVRRIHGQLRRLTRRSRFSEEVQLTAISKSRVFFNFASDPQQQQQQHHQSMTEQLDARSAGWIMFECGLEDLRLSAVHRSPFATVAEAPAAEATGRNRRLWAAITWRLDRMGTMIAPLWAEAPPRQLRQLP